ncbi:ABC transporter ATP-binding protein [Williamsia serinedens]|uniref:NitT/TauT family transport system ATP-binding protein n=1 Tax=Williamsia serinedens TaxID=391736 RepID=A0ABT1H2S9_9NOCA|nr:nitrate/sulfonate/bicarbonate ABC transporter ATP-binding protein [Williamsia serinedens]MCP2161539.1 NitT/TauT family transport system ATP-binding protein [Williamsia serinedens]
MTLTSPTSVATDLVTVEDVHTTFTGAKGQSVQVLDGIDLTLHEGEIVALLGRSGSGKSTLLRTVAGLIPATSGTVRYRGTPLTGANPGTALVFQSFALMPWLTVQDNVELGLVARRVPAEERRERALAAIDLIGLDGFESAYPRELSGGMRQRVGFARALVLRPDVLLMDEPFSALDVLTAENLRSELIDLWEGARFPTRAICIVTHNIDEAVALADRVVVLGSHPGRIIADIPVPGRRHRDPRSVGSVSTVDTLYRLLTEGEGTPPVAPVSPATPGDEPLPEATVGGIAGLVAMVAGEDEPTMASIASALTFDISDLLPLVDAAELLGFIEVTDGRIGVTDLGTALVGADIQRSKQIFATQAGEHAPLVRAIVTAVRSSPHGTLRGGFFLDLLRRRHGPDSARRQLETAVDWGRYGELFEYDTDDDVISVPV